MTIIAAIVVWLNTVANYLGQAFFFIELVPGWLSATIIGMASGVAMILAFKFTSNQRAIKRARQKIRANLLAVRLFHDSLLVGFRAQGRVLLAAISLLGYAIIPILAMLVPMTLLLSQLALWYQARPLRVREEAVITLRLRGDVDDAWPTAILAPNDAIEDMSGGPVHVYSQREICWNVRALVAGHHRLIFRVDGKSLEKDLAIGRGFMLVSTRRPAYDWQDMLLNPAEDPLGVDSVVESIEIQYPSRISWTSGTDYWVYYWFLVSLVTGFLCRGLFKVNL